MCYICIDFIDLFKNVYEYSVQTQDIKGIALIILKVANIGWNFGKLFILILHSDTFYYSTDKWRKLYKLNVQTD